MSYTVTFIPGDGTGPEIAEATKRALEATGVKFDWDIQNAGADVYEKEGNPLPARVIKSLKENKVGIKGPITTPVGSGFRSVNVALRKELDLYCCLRPCKSYEGVQSRYTNIDLVIVRENTEDLYAGIEYQKGSSSAAEMIATIERLSGVKIREDSGISIKPISEFGTRRIVKFALEYAREYKRKRLLQCTRQI